MYLKNTAGQFIHFQGVDATTGGIKSGVTWTVRRCIDGTFAAAGGTATEDGTTGWYKFALTQADTNGNDIGFNFTGTGAVPQTVNIVTTILNPYDAAFGLVLAKTTNITGLNDIAATAVVSAGAITTSGGAVSTVTTTTTATNLTNAPTAGDFTATMKTSLNAATPAVTVSDKTGFSLTAAYDPAKTAAQAGDAMTLTGAYDAAKTALTTGTVMLESYAADGATATAPQMMYMIWAMLAEKSIAATTLTARKLDGSTAAMTFTLDSATAPTSITRAT